MFWYITCTVYISGMVIGLAVIHRFELMYWPRCTLFNSSQESNHRFLAWFRGHFVVLVIYLIFHGWLWNLELVAKYQAIEMLLMTGTMLATAGFLQLVNLALTRHWIERPRRGGPQGLKT